MTNEQINRAVAEELGWEIEFRCLDERNWSNTESLPSWNWLGFTYRAVGPRNRVELKRGMEVRTPDGDFLVIASACPDLVILADMFGVHKKSCNVATHYRWPNSNGEWLPIEGEPEIISMEGVE